MNIHITDYYNGKVFYRKDNIPSSMDITSEMIKEVFPSIEKTFPYSLGMLDEELVTIIERFHTLRNHIAIQEREVYKKYCH
jgi:hypothetical protein